MNCRHDLLPPCLCLRKCIPTAQQKAKTASTEHITGLNVWACAEECECKNHSANANWLLSGLQTLQTTSNNIWCDLHPKSMYSAFSLSRPLDRSSLNRLLSARWLLQSGRLKARLASSQWATVGDQLSATAKLPASWLCQNRPHVGMASSCRPLHGIASRKKWRNTRDLSLTKSSCLSVIRHLHNWRVVEPVPIKENKNQWRLHNVGKTFTQIVNFPHQADFGFKIAGVHKRILDCLPAPFTQLQDPFFGKCCFRL